MTTTQTFRTLAAACALSALVACGGGGGSDGDSGEVSPPPAPAPEPSTGLTADQLQGRWLSATGISPQQALIVAPTAAGSAEMTLWSLSSDFSVARLTVSTTGPDGVTAQGSQWTAGQPGAQALSYTGTANLLQETLSLNSATLLFNRTDTLAGGSQLSDVVGAWSASLGGNALTLRWSLAADGTLTGTSTTGCTYAGQLRPRADVALFDAEVQEACTSGNQGFRGIATYRAQAGSTPAALTLVAVSTDAAQSSALALLLAKD